MKKKKRQKEPIIEQRIALQRSLVAVFIGFILLGILLIRTYQLQVTDYKHYTTLSNKNRIQTLTVAPVRGNIYDRRNRILANNIVSFDLSLQKANIGNLNDTIKQLRQFITISGLDLKRFKRELRRNRPYEPSILKKHLSETELATLAANRHLIPGLMILQTTTRQYPYGIETAHAVGYVGRINQQDETLLESDPALENNYRATNHIGKTGIEKHYEVFLHGRAGARRVETDVRGNIIRTIQNTPATPGGDLYLSLDIELQKFILELLAEEKASVVAIEPSSGEILAFVSTPSYDANLFVNGISHKDFKALNEDKLRPLYNRALRGMYPPGSTIKPIMGLAGLEFGAITHPENKMFAGPYYQIEGYDYRYRDWNRAGHGWVDLNKAIAQSCDVYFYDMAHRTGIDRLNPFFKKFGIGVKTNIDIYAESSGLMPSREWKQKRYNKHWFPGDTVNIGIGQGYMLTTPLQLAYSTAIIANRGKRVKPHFVKNLPHESTAMSPINLKNPQWWNNVIEGMKNVIHSDFGTARSIGKDLPYTMAGKSGTVQVFNLKGSNYNVNTLPKHLHDHALFVAFAPLENPKIVVSVVIENGGGGSSVAAPIAQKVIDYYLMNISKTNLKVSSK